MKFSKDLLFAESEFTRFWQEILEKVFHLASLLKGFNSHPFLKRGNNNQPIAALWV